MAPRSYWKGYLKLSLVTCPVAMMPATTSNERVRFHTLNRHTGNRVVSRWIDEASGEPVDESDEVKGYERGEDDYVALEDEELDSVALESTRTIDIEMFTAASSVDDMWRDKPHYLAPDDPVGVEAFAVIRDAMAAAGVVGVSRLVLGRRERAVILVPRERGIILWTLRYAEEIRPAADYFSAASEAKGGDRAARALVAKLIEARMEKWKPELADDPVQDALLELIAEREGRKPARGKREKATEKGGNVVSIMDALRRSLAAKGASTSRQ